MLMVSVPRAMALDATSPASLLQCAAPKVLPKTESETTAPARKSRGWQQSELFKKWRVMQAASIQVAQPLLLGFWLWAGMLAGKLRQQWMQQFVFLPRMPLDVTEKLTKRLFQLEQSIRIVGQIGLRNPRL